MWHSFLNFSSFQRVVIKSTQLRDAGSFWILQLKYRPPQGIKPGQVWTLRFSLFGVESTFELSPKISQKKKTRPLETQESTVTNSISFQSEWNAEIPLTKARNFRLSHKRLG
jgi:hypothetical protein